MTTHDARADGVFTRIGDWLGDRLYGTRARIAILAAVVIIAVGYLGTMLWVHTINDDTDFVPPPAFTVPGGSESVSITAALINREVNETRWVANTPFPFPSSLLDNMPNFQLGLMYAISRFAIELSDTLGRVRGSSQVDQDLDKAAGLLKYDGTIWVWEPSVSLLPTAAAETQYRAGMRALLAFNERLARGEATFDRRADNLIQLLDRVAADLGSASATLDRRIEQAGWAWFDTRADDDFYRVKGRLYGYAMILSGVGRDFAAVIAERRAEPLWQEMLASLRVAAGLSPLVVSNAVPDSTLLPNHLAPQGFFLLRARTQMRELTQILTR